MKNLQISQGICTLFLPAKVYIKDLFQAKPKSPQPLMSMVEKDEKINYYTTNDKGCDI